MIGSSEKLLICAIASVMAHLAIGEGLELLPPLDVHGPPHKIDVRVVPAPEVPPPPEPPKPPEPPPPEPPKQVHDVPKARPVQAPTVAPVAKDAPPPDHDAVQTTATTDTPVYGVSMSSTSTGTGPAMPTGNTTKAPASSGDPHAKPLAAPVAAFEATKLPLPQGRCFGKYTDEARAAGTEGTVVLDLVVGEDGHVRDVQVVSGLANGLTEAAVKALRECMFSPGEKNGTAVAVKVRGFKIRFVLAEANP